MFMHRAHLTRMSPRSGPAALSLNCEPVADGADIPDIPDIPEVE